MTFIGSELYVRTHMQARVQIRGKQKQSKVNGRCNIAGDCGLPFSQTLLICEKPRALILCAKPRFINSCMDRSWILAMQKSRPSPRPRGHDFPHDSMLCPTLFFFLFFFFSFFFPPFETDSSRSKKI
jgi:hypothetical protein